MLLANTLVQLPSAQITSTPRQLPRQTATPFTHSISTSLSLSTLNTNLIVPQQHQAPTIRQPETSSALNSYKADNDKHQQQVNQFTTTPTHPPQPQGSATHTSSSTSSLQKQQQQHPPGNPSSSHFPQSSGSHLRELMTTSSAEAPTSMSATPASQSSNSVTCQQLPSSSSSSSVNVSIITAEATTPKSALPSSVGAADSVSNPATLHKSIRLSNTPSLPTTVSSAFDYSTSSPPSSSSSPSASSESTLTASMPSETRSWMTQEITPAVTSMPLHDLQQGGPLPASMTHKKHPSWNKSVDYQQQQRPTHPRQFSLEKPDPQLSQYTQAQELPVQPQQHPSYTLTSTSSMSPPLISAPPAPIDSQQQISRRRSVSERPWTNAEQESLYIAVEKHGLFGQWHEVKTRMKLDRTVQEIEDEYMRIYGELHDSEEDDEELPCSPSSTTGKQGGVYGPQRQQQQQSSSAPSSASSPSSVRSSFSFASASGGIPSAMSLMARHEQMFPPIQYESIFERDEGEDEDHPDGGDMEVDYKSGSSSTGRFNHHEEGASSSRLQQHPPQHAHRGSTTSSPTRMRRPSTHLPTHTKSASSVSGMSDHHNSHQHQHHHRTASESHGSSSSRPTRMVRVWTPEQSERLKNLIELYFPGAYRINWVWVAEQMGNNFTRKQCKNKWEIMRRRMGTEEEIQLLKKGYEEFGPSWGEIQEKYLPERSRGGIEIMWELLESREAGQNQPPPPPPQLLPTVTQLKQSALPVDDQYHLQSQSRQQSSSSVTGEAASLNRKQRASGLSIATRSIPQHGSASSPRSALSKGYHGNNSASNHTPSTSFSAGGLATSDVEAMEISSPSLSMVSPRASISAPVSSSTTATTAGVHGTEGDRELAKGEDVWRQTRRPENVAVGSDAHGNTAWGHERTATGSSSIGMSIDSGSGSASGSPSMQQHAHAHEENMYYSQPQEEDGGRPESMQAGAMVNSSGSSDRSAPMIWTEPLTRRLEQAIQEHFPNGEKVNWAKISALMGNNPAVSRDQCKRRWYLISQNQFYQRRHNEMQAAASAAAAAATVGATASSSQQYAHQNQQRQRVTSGGGAGSSPSMATMMEMDTTEREVQQQQQMHQYYTQHAQYFHSNSQSQQYSKQHSPRDGWSE
ncbi:hypothetical protein BGW41_004262 [Actinomortierella wolfii]|nr:hypothetical protein BGW41_004262 [Actinomortierella wolfii]